MEGNQPSPPTHMGLKLYIILERGLTMKSSVNFKEIARLVVTLALVEESGEKAIQLARRVNGYPNRSELNTAIKRILTTMPVDSVVLKLAPAVGMHI